MKKEQNNQPSTDSRMALTTKNYVLMLIGFAVIVLGFVLMSGGGSA